MPISMRISATLGFAITASRRFLQSGANVTTSAPLDASTRSPPAVAVLRPSSFARRSGTSRATTSITFCASASSADRLTASRTARSAHSTLCPRICAKPRMYAAASCTCLRSIAPPSCAGADLSDFSSLLSLPDLPLSRSFSGACGPPMPIATGVAAPRFVPGAIAAKWLA